MKYFGWNFTTVMLALASFCAVPSLSYAQTAPAPAAAIAPPMLPLVTVYRYWPEQFVQFVGDELPYSMIELDVDTGASKKPLLFVTLTERATGKRIHYGSDDGLLAAATTTGEEAHKTAIAFDSDDTDTPGSISTVRLMMADGKPLEWRFVLGSNISKQGSGLNPFPKVPFPFFAYREQGGLAGEGTALKIGNVVSTAAVWTENSHPPYFVAYRGAETEGSHSLLFLPGQQVWTVKSSPQALIAGASWELDEAHGDHRTIHIDKVDGEQMVVTSTDKLYPRVRCTLDVTRAGNTWSIDRARFGPVLDGEKHELTLQFVPTLSMHSDHVAVILLAAKKKTIASGEMGDAAGPRNGMTLTFSNPAWLAGKTIIENKTVTNGTVTLSAHP